MNFLTAAQPGLASSTHLIKSKVGMVMVRTIEAVRNVDLQLDIAEQHGKRHGEVALCPEGDVPVAGLQVLEGQDSLAQHLVVVVVHSEPEHGELRKNNLLEEGRRGSYMCPFQRINSGANSRANPGAYFC